METIKRSNRIEWTLGTVAGYVLVYIALVFVFLALDQGLGEKKPGVWDLPVYVFVFFWGSFGILRNLGPWDHRPLYRGFYTGGLLGAGYLFWSTVLTVGPGW